MQALWKMVVLVAVIGTGDLGNVAAQSPGLVPPPPAPVSGAEPGAFPPLGPPPPPNNASFAAPPATAQAKNHPIIRRVAKFRQRIRHVFHPNAQP
jgi:hypothetical protein